MTSILQWGHRVLGWGRVYSRARVFLFFWRLPTWQEIFSLELMRLSIEDYNLALVVVREELDLANYSNIVFSVVAAAAKTLKYLSRSVADLIGPFAWSYWILGACLSTPWAAPNWSWPPTDCFLTLAFRSAVLYRFFQAGPYFFLGKVLPDFICLGETLFWKHCVCCNEEEGVFRYGVPRYLGVFLFILKRVYILRNGLHLLIVVLHLVL